MSTPWKELAERGQISEAIMEYIKQNDWVSFAEICWRFGPYLETRGGFSLDTEPNCIIWAGLSEQLSSIIQDLLKRRKVFLHPASILTYILDGATLRFPIAKRPPANGYKTPHWLPVCLRLVPLNLFHVK